MTMVAGDKFGSLVFTGTFGRMYSAGQYRATGVFKCVCGKTTTVTIQNIEHGKTKSCGCQRYGAASVAKRKSTMEVRANAEVEVDDVKWKPSRSGAKLVRCRHNYDAAPRHMSMSIGSSMEIV